MISEMSRKGMLYNVAGGLAALAALAVVLSNDFLPREYARAAMYAFWAVVMFTLGYRARQKTS